MTNKVTTGLRAGAAWMSSLAMAGMAFAQDAAPAAADAAATPPPHLDTGHTAWILVSTGLVLLMTIPGLALFYAGMVRKKNILATLAQSFSATALITVLWMGTGYL